MKKQRDLNFYPTIECETNRTPHHIYQCLAIDAVLMQMDEQLPKMSDEEHERLLDAATTASATVLELARVPDDWLSFLAALHRKREEKVRSELWEIVFDLLPSEDYQEKVKAEKNILACAKPGREEAMRLAVNDLSNAYGGEVLQVIYAAFHLGYEIAHDPTRLIMEKGQ